MVRSAVPPPVAKVWRCHGHQAMAFTAATCSVKVARGRTTVPAPLLPPPLLLLLAVAAAALAAASHRQRRFSLPPEAKVAPSGDHARPQTSWVWATKALTTLRRCRRSWLRICESRPPEESHWPPPPLLLPPFQAKEATRARWPVRSRTYLEDEE